MPRVTDTVLDDDGAPVRDAMVTVTLAVSQQVPGVDGAPGTPAVTQLVWRGRTDQTGTWEADLPPQSRWGNETYYTASVRHTRRGLKVQDEFTVAEPAEVADRAQKVVDRLRGKRRPRPPRADPARPGEG